MMDSSKSCYPGPNRYDTYGRVRPSHIMTPLPDDAAVTMAYVPFQLDTEIYDDMKALEEGTLFPILNKPFLGAGMRR